MGEIKTIAGDSFNADIFIAGNLETIERVCRQWVMKGACVTITPQKFVFTGGLETGTKIGFINYQRFPSTPEDITKNALTLAEELIKECCQFSASVVTTNETFFLHTDSKR